MLNFRPVILSLTLLLTITGCSLAPSYQQPDAPIPEEWALWPEMYDEQSSVNLPVDWQTFVIDEQLKRIVNLALDNNRDLRQVLLNVQAVRSQYNIQRSSEFPSISAGIEASRQRQPLNALGLGDSLGSGNGPESITYSQYRANLGMASYELDLLGRASNLSEVALQNYLASEHGANSARLSLISEVIQAYLLRESSRKQFLLFRKLLETEESALNLMSQRLEVGEITRLEYQVALSNIHQVRIQFERSKQILQQSKNALILLVGTEIDNELLSNPPSSKMVLLQELSAGSPSSLLLNRPDIRAAEHRLMAQNANIGVARAAFFPRISLTALFGGISPELSTLFDSNQQSWSVGSSINIPIFNGGKNSANLDLAVLRKEIAIAAYEGTIQDAFHEVSNALVALHAIKNQSAAQKQSSQAADYRHELSTQRYQQGSDSLFNLLEAQKFAITNQLALVEAQAKEQLTLVTLFRSLGGGWYTADSPSDSKPIAL